MARKTLDIEAIDQAAREGRSPSPALTLELCAEIRGLHKLLEEVRREAVEERRLVRT